MSEEMMKEQAEQMGFTWRKDELMKLPDDQLRAGYLKFNIPNPKTPEDLNGEGVWGWAKSEDKARYDDDQYTGKLTVVLCNDPLNYGGVLFEGIEVVIQCNGDKRPILDPEWVQEKLIDSGLYQVSEEPLNRMKSVCMLALTAWGTDAQTLMVFEEMSELQKELCKHARGKDNRAAIAEEIADVEIMLEQMKILHNCAGAVEGFRRDKLDRLEQRALAEIAASEGAKEVNVE